MFGWFKLKKGAGVGKVESITTLDEAIRLIDAYEGAPQEFLLPIADSLNDSFGVNMALITDKILGRGWEPDGFTQGQGFRVYRYKELL